jgi:hypothetical protein
MNLPELKFHLNYCLSVGRNRVTKKEIVSSSQGDIGLALLKIREWEAKGWLDIIANLLEAEDDQFCIEIHSPIDNERPWSDPMSGRM